MFLSVVLIGRNDGHGGNFEERLFTAAGQNRRLLTEAGLSFEYVWVEWNTPAGQPLLGEKVLERIPEARALVCDAAVHAACCDNPNMPVMEFFAKNAGIRRSQGRYVLTTNADILLSPAVVEELKKVSRRPSPEFDATVYRAVRRDLAPGATVATAANPSSWQFSNALTPPYFAEGSGDFLLASKACYEALRGFDETIRYAKLHKDTRFCIHAQKLGCSFRILGDVYHLYHPNSWITLPVDRRYAANAPWGPPYNYRANLPYLNPPNWGLADYREEPVDERTACLVKQVGDYNDEETAGATPSRSVLEEAERLRQLADCLPVGDFQAEYVAGLARELRRRPDPAETALVFLKKYLQTVWTGLNADLNCREHGVALYGAGRHAEWFLHIIQGIAGPRIQCLLDDYVADGQVFRGLPIRRPSSIDPEQLGAIVISSDLHEEAIHLRCVALFGDRLRVVRLYEGLPTGLFTQDAGDW